MTSAAPGQTWQRFHPLSPLLRGGLLLVAVAGYLLSQAVDTLTAAVFGDSFGPYADEEDVPGDGGSGTTVEVSPLDHPVVAGVVLLLVLVGVVAVAGASWWFSRYRLGSSTLEVRTGAVFRQHRQIRYARIQAVSIRRPILARLTGLSEVVVESAGGGDSHARLAYLRHPDALTLQERLLGLAQRSGAPLGGAPAGGPASPHEGPAGPADATRPPEDAALAPDQPEGPPLVSMPFARLLGSILLSGQVITMAGLAVVGLGLASLGAGFALGGLAAPLVFAAFAQVRRLLTWSNLTVRRRGDHLAVAYGLTDLSTSTIPVRRVQALELRQPWLWRAAGWWRLSVNVAGVKLGATEVGGEGVLVPAGTEAEVRAALATLAPDADLDRVAAAMGARLPQEGCYASPRAARWLDPATWRRNGVVVGDEAVVIRRGLLARVVQVVPHGRIQSMAMEQGPTQRRLGLAQVRLVSTVGTVDPRTPHLTVLDAERLYAEEGGRARRARSRRERAHADPPTGAGCDSVAQRLDLTGMEPHGPEGHES